MVSHRVWAARGLLPAVGQAGAAGAGGRRGRTARGVGAPLPLATEVDRAEPLLYLPRRAHHNNGFPPGILPRPQQSFPLLHLAPQPSSLVLQPAHLQAGILGHRLGEKRGLVEVDPLGAGLGPPEGDPEPLLAADPDVLWRLQQRRLVLSAVLAGPLVAIIPTLVTLAVLASRPSIGRSFTAETPSGDRCRPLCDKVNRLTSRLVR